MRDNRVYEIVVISIFTALIVLMALVPMLGFIQIGAVAVTLLHIPVLIGGIFGGRKTALYLATVFGVMSMLIAFIRPAGPIDLLFQNPLISVLPRVIFGYALYEIYRGLETLIKNEYISIPISMVLSTIVHTVLVLTSLFVFGRATLESIGFESLFTLIWVVMSSNGILEAILAGLVGGPIAKALLAYKQADLM